MFSPSRVDSASKPAPAKRSLFNKPAWSSTQPGGDAVDIFRRSDQTYADIVAEEEKRRNRRLARKQKELAKLDHEVLERAGKRRRISDYSEDEADQTSNDAGSEEDRALKLPQKSLSTHSGPDTTTAPAEQADREGSPKSLLKRYESTVTAEQNAQERKMQAPTVIDLEDDEEEQGFGLADEPPTKPPQAVHETPPEAEDFLPSDEEFPELARQAREKARLKRMEKEKEATPMKKSPSMTESDQKLASDATRHEPVTHPPPPDPTVDILVTSHIPNTRPLIVSRKVTQRLKDVRITWCQRQGFNAEATASIFLTWRGKRLFDVTTCRGLGIGVDTDGNVVLNGERDVLDEENRQIHMEAMTEELLDEHKKARHESTIGGADNKDEAIVEPPKQPTGIKIILRSKDYEDFKLIVKTVRAGSCRPHLLLTDDAAYNHLQDRQCI